MGDQLLVGEQRARAEEDRPVQRIAVEAAEPRQAEEPRCDPDPHAAQRDGTWIRVVAVEPRLSTLQRGALLVVHAARLMKLLLTGPQGAGKTTVGELVAKQWERGVHVDGDVFRRFVVSGRTEMTENAPPEALVQL